MTTERQKTLLFNAIAMLEDHYEMSIFDCDLADEIGITTEEYDEIMEGQGFNDIDADEED